MTEGNFVEIFRFNEANIMVICHFLPMWIEICSSLTQSSVPQLIVAVLYIPPLLVTLLC